MSKNTHCVISESFALNLFFTNKHINTTNNNQIGICQLTVNEVAWLNVMVILRLRLLFLKSSSLSLYFIDIPITSDATWELQYPVLVITATTKLINYNNNNNDDNNNNNNNDDDDDDKKPYIIILLCVSDYYDDVCNSWAEPG